VSTFRVAIYQTKASGSLTWQTLGLGDLNRRQEGRTALKIQRELTVTLRQAIAKCSAERASQLFAPRGIALARTRLALTLKDAGRRKLSGLFPIVTEPRWVTRERRVKIAYHPDYQAKWFVVDDDRPLDEQAALYFAKAFAELEDFALDQLTTNKKDLVTSFSFEAHHKSVIDTLPDSEGGLWDDLVVKRGPKQEKERKKGGLTTIPSIGVNQTTRAIEGSLPVGAPRPRYRDPMLLHLAGQKRKPVLLVGPPGCGKTTIFNHFVKDLVDADDFPTHRNLDRIHEVWSTSGKRIIAGMSYLGQWEERVNAIVSELRGRKLILYAEDLSAWGRIGRTRDSDRSLADAFRGPLERQEILLIGECTAEQLAQLEDDAPSFAALFTRLFVDATSQEMTYQIMFHEARALEVASPVAFEPAAFRTVYELTDSLFSQVAFPGKAVDLLHELAKPDLREASTGERSIGPEAVLEVLSARTGLPRLLLQPEQKLDPGRLGGQLERYVMGQPHAVDAAVDVVLRIRAGLTDPERPYAVYLFTGPTGTGKTELAKCIAEYLFGDKRRLLRLDMSELSGPDAAARLVGDRFQPEGMLTQPVLDQPFCTVLLDEVEKAHPSVLNLLLQLFDEGRLTDARGFTADFTHTVVIMTSNLGARARPAVGFSHDDRADAAQVDEAVRAFFPPELFNRIDRIVPFLPLQAETAVQIAEKELSRLSTRRGLTERSIFLFAGEPVLRRVVREGFDAERGARPLQRYLDQHVGSLLTDHITRSEPASMQIVRVYPSPSGFTLDASVLREAEPVDDDYALTPWLDKTAEETAGALDGALEVLERIIADGWVERLDDRISRAIGSANPADDIYHLDAAKLRLTELITRLEGVKRSANPNDPDFIEATTFTHSSLPGRSRVRMFDSRSGARPMTKDAIFEVVAEAEFLRRTFERIDEPGQHTIFVELLRVGHARHRGRFGDHRTGLLESLAAAYLEGPGELSSYAGRLTDGRLVSRVTDDEKAVPLHRGPAHLVLELNGLGILDRFETEIGSHVWQSLASGTELVRVSAWAAPLGDTAEDVVARFLTEEEAFEAAVVRGDTPLPPSPYRLFPAVRKLRYEVTEDSDRPTRFEIEHYRRAEVTVHHARSLTDALRPGWLLEKSRRRR
jgi:ATP-dependent Clp protease ATP-binding subunit ClpC